MMAPNEVIDLTGSSPPPEYIELNSDDDAEYAPSARVLDYVASQPDNGTRRSKRRKKRVPKAKMMETLEEGEVADPLLEQPREKNALAVGGEEESNFNGTPVAPKGKNKPGSQSKRSLLDRLSSPKRDVEEEEAGRREKGSKRRRRNGRSPDRRREANRNDQRRSRSPEFRRKDMDLSRSPAKDEAATLFFVDLEKIKVTLTSKPIQPAPEPVNPNVGPTLNEQPPLLLPAHVSVFGEGGVDPVEILPPSTPDSEDEGFIQYLDYDDNRRAPGMVRYFETVEEIEKSAKPRKIVCKKCGAEGEHETSECRVMICLTCGARDEHPTRNCPISKICHNCNMRGHISMTCPNRHSSRRGTDNYDICGRCGSGTHSTKECPTLWRLYEYVDNVERQLIMKNREEKRALALGQGGEGYIATDEWCYNCGGSGHLGDDCQAVPHVGDMPREPSAFGSYNTSSGPFADLTERPLSRPNASRPPRDWEAAGSFADGFGFIAPMDVGKKGRLKEREKLRKRARELEEAEDDEDDWFSRGPSRQRNRDEGGRRSSNRRGEDRREFSRRDDGRRYVDGRQRRAYEGDSVPSRETDVIHIRGASRYDERRSDRYDRPRDRDRRDERGPRYKGSYSR
ncbi:uncharacterized protein LAESUDRAFT_725955 [Laetiporus sulphureus 93-53]|uniref:CCHC-type domain-containing protein n=1 Tax=Laetiporus sulphureus 93-53 TaxID=1314785 RepID=A0A165E945_9APHY|nr:uncharacterized protein LAESUDRAFT_725955 [Laetiporus sulphureus 93-53]KZT06504.1 hypothetical protein LAESUDRAFT_725955 [Laetiporus sulphureus 93-53]